VHNIGYISLLFNLETLGAKGAHKGTTLMIKTQFTNIFK
jgi:hypothetical protein